MTAPRTALLEKIAVRWRSLLHALSVGLLALMLALAPTTRAQASLLDCIEAVAPADIAAKVAQETGEIAACMGTAASDPVEAAIVAAIVALVAADLIPANTQQCDAIINSVIAQLVAQALVAAGIDFGGDALKDLANGVPGVSLTDIPGFGQFLACGCIIAGAPDAAKQIAGQYLEHVEGCGDFFKGVGETILNWLEHGLYDLLWFIGGCSPAGGGDSGCWEQGLPPPDLPQSLWSGGPGQPGKAWQCYSHGYQCDACGFGIACSQIPHAIGVIAGKCTCEAPYTGVYYPTQTDYYGDMRYVDVLDKCVCNPPNISIDDKCLCPLRHQLKDGVCIPCLSNERYVPTEGKCIPCSMGQRASPGIGDTCVPVCDASKGEYALTNLECRQCDAGANVVYDLGVQGGIGHCEPKCASGRVLVKAPIPGPTTMVPMACFTCPENKHAVYDNPDSSLGRCEACPAGTTSSPGATECTPLDCGTSGYQDPDNPNACKYCPATQIYIPAKKEITTSPGGQTAAVVVAGHCGCPEGATLVATLQTTPSPLGVAQPSQICQCQGGSKLDPTGTKCVCPYGLHFEGGKCVPPLVHAVPLPKDCSTLGPNFINNPKNAAACVRCPAGRVANKAGTACVRVPAPAVPRGQTMKPALRCPPRTTPNAAGTACIPQLDMPDFGTPGSLAPPGGRGVPGVGAPTRR